MSVDNIDVLFFGSVNMCTSVGNCCPVPRQHLCDCSGTMILLQGPRHEFGAGGKGSGAEPPGVQPQWGLGAGSSLTAPVWGKGTKPPENFYGFKCNFVNL